MAMMKAHLSGSNYLWLNELSGIRLLTHGPGEGVFNRYNGYHMLAMIQYFLSQQHDGKKIERSNIEILLINYLPFETITESAVYHWLTSTHSRIKNMHY